VTDESGRRSPTWTWREDVLVRVIVTDGDRIQRFELFDICDTDRGSRASRRCAPPSVSAAVAVKRRGTSGRPQAELETEHL